MGKRKDSEADLLLKESAHWKNLQRQLSPAEQITFMEHWREILKQFKNDIFYTEYMTIIDLINIEIRINRLLEDQEANRATMRRSEEIIANEMLKDEDSRNSQLISSADSTLASCRGAGIQLDRKYLEMLEQKDKSMKSLKSTRDQRVKLVENSKSNFQDWTKLMIDSPEKRAQVGLEMEKFRLAMNNELERLSKPKEYLDNEVDLPILNSETVGNLG